MSDKGVILIGLMQLKVLDIEKTLKHYTDILGLNYVCETSDGRICLKGYDEFDHHSLVLKKSDEACFDFAAFKVNSEETLLKIEKETKDFGYDVYKIQANTDQPGFGRRIGLVLPTGHKIELYCDVEKAKQVPPIHNPDIWSEQPRGMKCQRLDPLLLYGPNIKEAEKYLKEVLGFYAPEVCNDKNGNRVAKWLTSSNKPHDIAFVEFSQFNKIHHIGFLLEDWNGIGNDADIMAINRIKRDVGSTRHAITRGQTIYFCDPSGNRNETYSGGYTAYRDHPQKTWDFDELGRGLFYYEGELIPSFLSIVT